MEVQSATLSHRYRYMENSAGVVTNNQIQHNEGFKGKFKFDKKGNYAINAGLFSGNNLTGGWNNTGSGKDKLFTNLYLKQLYLEAKPFKGIELQYGSLYPNRGENTEITSYDNDVYLMGERVSLKRPKNFFFDEVSATYGLHWRCDQTERQQALVPAEGIQLPPVPGIQEDWQASFTYLGLHLPERHRDHSGSHQGQRQREQGARYLPV